MADTKVSALTAASALTGTEEFGANQGGNSRKVTSLQNQAFAWKAQLALAPTGAIAETVPRIGSLLNTAGAALVSGRLHLVAIWLPKDALVTSISLRSGSTAAGTPTNQWFALLDSSRTYLRSTTNDTTTAWAANSTKTLNLSSTFTTTYSGLHYVGVMVTATTVPSLVVIVGVGVPVSDLMEVAPAVNGFSTTGMTTPVADGTVAAAVTGTVNVPYVYLS